MAAAAGDIDLVLVFGATGRSGKACFDACQAQGLKALAFARSRDKATRVLGNEARVAVGDVKNAESIEVAMQGVSHVIIALGSVMGEEGSCAEIVEYGAMKSILVAAKKVGSVKRIVYETSYGVEDPSWWFAGFLNHLAKDTLAWKLQAEMLLRESGIPYVVVRPMGLTDKDDVVPPAIKQTSPREWGMSRISRSTVGEICARALFLAPDCVTFSCRQDKKAGKVGLADFDFAGALGKLQRDRPMRSTFEDHIAGKVSFQKKLAAMKWTFRAGAVLGVALLAVKVLRWKKSLL